MKFVVLALALATCSFAANADPLPAGHPSNATPMAMMPPPIPKLTQEGTVLSVINAPNYTYVEVKVGEKIKWIAAPTLTASKGNTILFDDGAAMGDFYSKTLNRTFPSITFVSNVGVCHTK